MRTLIFQLTTKYSKTISRMKLERMMGYTGALNTECQHFSNRTIIRGAQE